MIEKHRLKNVIFIQTIIFNQLSLTKPSEPKHRILKFNKPMPSYRNQSIDLHSFFMRTALAFWVNLIDQIQPAS